VTRSAGEQSARGSRDPGIQRLRDSKIKRSRDPETDTIVGEPSTLTQEHWEVLSEVFGAKSLVLQVEWSTLEKEGVMRV